MFINQRILHFHKSPLKMMKNAFYFILKALFVLKIFYLDFSVMQKKQPSKHSSWWRRPEDVLKTSFIFVFRRRLQDVLKTSWSRPIYSSWPYVFKTSSRHLQDVLQRYLQDVFKAYHQVNLFYLTRPREVFNTFLSTEEFA